MQAMMNNPSLWLFVLFIGSLLFRAPIGIALSLSSIAVAWFWNVGVDMVSYNYFANIAKFQLLAIPFFIMAGNIMDKASIADKIIIFIKELVGDMTGGLAIAAIGVATFWGAVSGSTSATVAAIGIILIPGMVDSGYDKAFSTAVVCVASGLAIIIPPSITFILYSSITDVSIGAIFAAGFIPGITIALCLMVSAYITSKRKHYRGSQRTNGFRGILTAFKDAIWALLTPVIILGGIYGGIFTPTEAAAVACFYGLFVGVVIYRRISWKDMMDILHSTMMNTATVMFVAAGAGLFSWVAHTVGLIEKIAGLVLGLSSNQHVILLFIYVILFFAGMMLDGVSIVYIFVPMLMPIVHQFGWDPVWFGVMFTIMVAAGTITPPIAMNLFVGCRISNLTIEQLTPPVIPLLVVTLVGLGILTIFPQMTLLLPKALGLL